MIASHFGDNQYFHGMAGANDIKANDPQRLALRITNRAVTLSGNYRRGARDEQAFFDLGQSVHTLQDTYTTSHTSRNSDGEIDIFQDYTAQAGAYHALEDKYITEDEGGKMVQTEEDKKKFRQAVEITKKYLTMVDTNKGDDSFAKDFSNQFVRLAKEVSVGGTLDKFKPRHSVTGKIVDSAKAGVVDGLILKDPEKAAARILGRWFRE